MLVIDTKKIQKLFLLIGGWPQVAWLITLASSSLTAIYFTNLLTFTYAPAEVRRFENGRIQF
ncbi:hypothetical protein CS022_00570 [Veronia nyctiphanis]|uniref:Uncharacterized protein n=1 Tax=Veronia nyctiphanis TaxID=1278244 RepID=A0A4Q0YU35_9GAMM|nr:hypothetical protein CS022_00570 [Veronia nyctiphanis]